MKKVFISVGMRGRADEAVWNDINMAGRKIYEMFKGDVGIYHNMMCEKPDYSKEPGRLYYLGEAIKKLGECDVCYFVEGWQNYKGCKAEYEICKLYGIEIIEGA